MRFEMKRGIHVYSLMDEEGRPAGTVHPEGEGYALSDGQGRALGGVSLADGGALRIRWQNKTELARISLTPGVAPIAPPRAKSLAFSAGGKNYELHQKPNREIELRAGSAPIGLYRPGLHDRLTLTGEEGRAELPLLMLLAYLMEHEDDMPLV